MEDKIITLLQEYPKTRNDILNAFSFGKRKEVMQAFSKMEMNGIILDMFSDGRYVVSEDLRNDSNY